jgi:hypothetical protein
MRVKNNEFYCKHYISKKMGIIWIFMYVIQHCFICRFSDSTVSEDAEVETGTVATLALTARRSDHSARSHPRRMKTIFLIANEKGIFVSNFVSTLLRVRRLVRVNLQTQERWICNLEELSVFRTVSLLRHLYPFEAIQLLCIINL